MRWVGYVLCFLCSSLFMAPGMATTVTIAQQVVDANMQPAPGATVIIRVRDWKEGKNHREIRLHTGVDGFFTTRLEIEPDPTGFCPAYLLADIPGNAITMEALFPDLKIRTGRLLVFPSPAFTGVVVDEQNVPVADATVALGAVGSPYLEYVLNRPQVGVTTPELTTHTAADGTFTLRNIGSGLLSQGIITASKEQDGQTCWGLSAPIKMPAKWPREPVKIVLHAPVTVCGQVLDSADDTPLPGVTVALKNDPDNLGAPAQPVVTGADGAFTLPVVSPFTRLLAGFTHDDFCTTEVAFPTVALTEHTPAVISATCFITRAVTVTGRILDEETGLPIAPTWMTIDTASVGQGCTAADVPPQNVTTTQRSQATMQSDATFTLRTGPGANAFTVISCGYKFATTTRNIPEGGANDLTIKVAREHGVLLHFLPPTPGDADNLDITVRRADGQPGMLHAGITPLTQGFWFYDPTVCGTQVELQLERAGAVVLPWTRIPMEFTRWPVEMRLRK